MPREAPVMKRVLPASVAIGNPGLGNADSLLPSRAATPARRSLPSGFRPLPFVVLPLEDPPGDEAVDRLARGEPGLAQPRGALEDAAFDRRDRLRAIGALVLEQVAQVLAREQAHP